MSAAEAALPPLNLDDVLAAAGAFSGAGRKAKPLEATFLRSISEADMIDLATNEAGIKPPTIKELRQSHHTIAQLLSKGTLSETEISSITGYSISRISILKGDPSFQEILSYYKGMEAEGYKTATADMQKRLSSLGFDSIETLHQRLIETPESFDNKTLLAVVEAASDRTGHGKTSTVNSNVNVGLAPETLAAIREGRPSDAGRAAADRQALLSLAARSTAEAHPIAEAGDCIEGEGTCLREEGDQGAEAAPPGPRDAASLVRVS